MPRIPAGNIVTLDATSDRSFLLSTDRVHLIRFISHVGTEDPLF